MKCKIGQGRKTRLESLVFRALQHFARQTIIVVKGEAGDEKAKGEKEQNPVFAEQAVVEYNQIKCHERIEKQKILVFNSPQIIYGEFGKIIDVHEICSIQSIAHM
jgi:hypothetical protein